jgi:hypothetical protein
MALVTDQRDRRDEGHDSCQRHQGIRPPLAYLIAYRDLEPIIFFLQKLLIAERMGKADEEAQPEASPKQMGVPDSSDKLPGAIDMEDYDWSESVLKLSMNRICWSFRTFDVLLRPSTKEPSSWAATSYTS